MGKSGRREARKDKTADFAIKTPARP